MKSKKDEKKAVEKVLKVSPAKMMEVAFKLIGTTPYVSNNFGAEARQMMRNTQTEGSTARGKKPRTPKDFIRGFEESLHKTVDGKYGAPAAGFRAALISACRTVDFTMTRAKLAVFVEADGFDAIDGTGLCLFTKGEPRHVEHFVRNDNGSPDIRARAMFDPGWEMMIRIRYDADMFSLNDIANLLSRAGQQVGIGAGRPDSKDSTGMGWGLFRIQNSEETN